jgi:spore germination protein YaaH
MQTGKWTCRLLALIGLWLLSGPAAGAEGILYIMPDDSGWESLLSNEKKISILAPDVLSVDREGAVTGAVEEKVREFAAKRGLRVMPLLSNEGFDPEVAHAVLSDRDVRRKVISESLRLCRQNSCWGLQLDFEEVLLEDKENYSQFVREAAGAFHAHNLHFSVAVPAPLVRLDPQRAASNRYRVIHMPYDLGEIAKHVDLLSLMTYDEHIQPDSPGPIASFNWVEHSIRYALRFVPRQKLSMGLPFYGRLWCNQQVSSISFAEVMALAARGGASSRWHSAHRSPWFEFDDQGCRGVLWYENRRSLSEKLRLMRKYRLAGFSAWRLGAEDPTFWRQVQERRR